jgi:diguanylate cyclase (GGDEF)-like protein
MRTRAHDSRSTWLRRSLRAVAAWGDPVSRDLAASGDLFVARFRLWLLMVLALIPLNSSLASPAQIENWLGLATVLVALAFAVGFLRLAKRPVPPWWLGFATSQFDVLVISLGFLSFIAAGMPIVATNSLVHYTMYFVALGGTGLRYDPRVCLAAGASALLQYGAIVLWVAANEPSVFQSSAIYGTFQWDSQASRLQLIAIATIINTTVVVRSRQFWLDSMRDRLTGLFNRAFFDASLTRLLRARGETGAPFSVAMIDLDHFKLLNDRHGHAAGDAALCEAAGRLRELLRDEDVTARYGGDEFAVVIQTDREAATGRLDAWRRQLATEAREPCFSASVGVSSFPHDGQTIDALLSAADRRLYAAKAQGRNRTIGDDVAA